MRLRWLLLFFIPFCWIPSAKADSVVDVSKEWNAHISSASRGVPISSTSLKAVGIPEESSDTLSCGCESSTVQERLQDSTYAFTGRVLDVGKENRGRRTVVFDVDEIFKGSPPLEMKVAEDLTGTSCDLPFERDQSFVVFAKWEWGSSVTSRCMGTKRLDKVRTEALGPSEELKEKLYIHLRDACMGRSDTSCCLASLKAMREGYFIPAPEEGCPSETIPDRLRCGGSYTWCIPVTDKNHRRPETH